MVFVFHPMTGVRQVPAAWLDAMLPSGFREATPHEIRLWHEERGLEPPPEHDTPHNRRLTYAPATISPAP